MNRIENRQLHLYALLCSCSAHRRHKCCIFRHRRHLICVAVNLKCSVLRFDCTMYGMIEIKNTFLMTILDRFDVCAESFFAAVCTLCSKFDRFIVQRFPHYVSNNWFNLNKKRSILCMCWMQFLIWLQCSFSFETRNWFAFCIMTFSSDAAWV